MSSLIYECQRSDHAHEIRQLGRAMQSLYDYYDGREELALFIGNVNFGEINLDGLIVKEDAIVIVEFKDYEGDLEASMNSDWLCDSKPIKGGSGGKSVFEQLKRNRSKLKKAIAENQYFTQVQRNDIQALVVLTRLDNCKNDFDRDTKAWVHMTDVDGIGSIMHEISARKHIDYKTRQESLVYISNEDIINFIRKKKINERTLITEFSDVDILPADLFHADKPHNGKHYSTKTQLKNKVQEVDSLKSELTEVQRQLETVRVELQKKVNERDEIINNQKVAQIAAEEKALLAEKKIWEEQQKAQQTSINAQQLEMEKKTFTDREKSLLDEIFALKDALKSLTVFEPKVEVSQYAIQLESQTEPVIPPKPIFVRTSKKNKKDFEIDEESMDVDQIDIIDKTLDKSMLVSGCAGSGKSVIALHKAKQILGMGGDVILIAYTKSLNNFMSDGNRDESLGSHFYYHWQWKNEGMPTADYIIVDEIQDFTQNEIQEFINSANKCYFFFGDTAQSIYKSRRPTLSIEEISTMTGLSILHLYNNYRLPRPVAKITQTYVAVDANAYAEKIYQSKERVLPRLIAYNSVEEQADAIIRIIAASNLTNVGIFVLSNELVLRIHRLLTDQNFVCEFKYSKGMNDPDNVDTLDFKNNRPKLMTYHSAKGLQFETVILPMFEGAFSDDARKALYVAMTRTYRNLYIMYVGTQIPYPLSDVPGRLYSLSE